MSGIAKEEDGEQRPLGNSNSEIDQLMRSLGQDVNISSFGDDAMNSITKPPNTSSLTVSPPPRDSNVFYLSNQSFLNSPPLFDIPPLAPSPTAPWINALPITNATLQSTQGDMIHGTLNNSNPASNLTKSNNVQSTPFESLSPSDSADLLDSALEYPWFPRDSNPALSNLYTSPLQLLNLSPVATRAEERSAVLPTSSYNNVMFMLGLNPSTSSACPAVTIVQNSPKRGRSPSPSRFNDVSPLISAPNSPFSSEGGYFSEGKAEDHAVVGACPSGCTTKRKTPDRALDESEEIQSPEGPGSKKQTTKKDKVGAVKLNKRVKEPRYAIKTRSDVEIMEDGYKWRKYGQKAVKNSPHQRSYYRCTNQKCPVRKRVERAAEDPGLVITTYEGQHNHLSPSTAASSSSRSPDTSCNVPAEDPGAAAAANFPFQPVSRVRSEFDLSMQIRGQKEIQGRQDFPTATTSTSVSPSPPRGILQIPGSFSRDVLHILSGTLQDDSQINNGHLKERLLRDLQGPRLESMAMPGPHLGRAQEIQSMLREDLRPTIGYAGLLDDILRQSGGLHRHL